MGWTSSQTHSNATLDPAPSCLALIPLPPSSPDFSALFSLPCILFCSKVAVEKATHWQTPKRGPSSHVAQPVPAHNSRLTQGWRSGRGNGISPLSAGACPPKSQPQFAESLTSDHCAFSAASLVLAAGLPVKQFIHKEFFFFLFTAQE